jgi:hypothetical protein
VKPIEIEEDNPMTSLYHRVVGTLPRTRDEDHVSILLEALPEATQRSLAILDGAAYGTAEWAFAVLPVGSRSLLERHGAAEFAPAADGLRQPATITDTGRALIKACAERLDVSDVKVDDIDEDRLRALYAAVVEQDGVRGSEIDDASAD